MPAFDPELFERFDPFGYQLPKDEYGNPTNTALDYVLYSAKEQLSTRSVSELNYALDLLDWMIEESEKAHLKKSLALLKNAAPEARVYMNPQRQLLTLFEEYDLSDQASFPNAKPEDYVAILALIKAVECLEARNAFDQLEKQKIRTPFPEGDAHSTKAASERLEQEALELIAFLDGLRFMRQDQIKKSKRGGKKKSSKFEALKTTILKRYKTEYYNLSNRKAAMILEAEFKYELDQTLNTDDPAKRIEIWIGRHKKSLNCEA